MRRTIFNEDHDLFRESVREFLHRSVTPALDSFYDAKALPREFWLEAGKQGLLGLEVPERFGGSDAQDYRFNAVLLEECSRVTMALGSTVGIHADVVAPYLVHLTTESQKERWLPGLCSGQLLSAIAMTEPSGGSDLAALRTSAERIGDRWRLNGTKTFITNGFSADLIVVAARTSSAKGSRGISLFGVEASKEGFHRGRKLDKVGQEEADTSELFFDDVDLSEDDLIGELDNGFVHMMTFLQQERLGCALSNLAHAAQILEETLIYVSDRKAFGRSIGQFQHNRFLVAELVTKIEVTQAFVDQAIAAHTQGELTPIDAAKAKWWTSDVQNEVIDACVQLHGGYGYMNEYRVGRAWRDARVTKIWAGSNEIMKELIGRDLGFSDPRTPDSHNHANHNRQPVTA